MLELHSSYSNKRSLFGRGRTIRLEAELGATPSASGKETIYVGSLVEHFLNSSQTLSQIFRGLNYSTSTTGTLNNVRGRPWISLGENSAGALFQNPQEEELFFVHGSLGLSPASIIPKKNSSAKNNSEKNYRFSYGLYTSFRSFPNSKQISYTVVARSRWETPEYTLPRLTPLSACRIILAEIHELRIGVEFFSPRSFGAAFGLTPSIEGRFYFTATPSRIKIVVDDSAADANSKLPLESKQLIADFETALEAEALFSELGKAVLHKSLS